MVCARLGLEDWVISQLYTFDKAFVVDEHIYSRQSTQLHDINIYNISNSSGFITATYRFNLLEDGTAKKIRFPALSSAIRPLTQ